LTLTALPAVNGILLQILQQAVAAFRVDFQAAMQRTQVS
jgi:hypothetical protein